MRYSLRTLLIATMLVAMTTWALNLAAEAMANHERPRAVAIVSIVIATAVTLILLPRDRKSNRAGG